MLTFSQCETLLGERVSKKLENNTYLERLDSECFGVRLHSTYVVRVYSDGSYGIDTGGWLTATTKDRINKYSPCRVRQFKHVWYVNGPGLDRDTHVLPGLPITVRPHPPEPDNGRLFADDGGGSGQYAVRRTVDGSPSTV